MDYFSVSPEETVMVGDNFKKDMVVAHSLGVKACWARYGIYMPRYIPEFLKELNVAKVAGRSLALDAEGAVDWEPVRLSGFDDLMGVV